MVNIDNILFDPPLISTRTIESINAERKNPAYLSLGIPVLNEFVMCRPTKVIGLLADTSQCKTTFKKEVAANFTEQINGNDGEVGIYFTWEDNIEDFGMKDIAKYSKVPVTSLYSGNVTDAEFNRMMKASAERATVPLWIAGHSEKSETRPMLTMTDVFAVCDNLVSRQGRKIKFIMLDYLQRINRADTQERDTRMQFVKIMDTIKNLALSYSTCVFISSQVRRDMVEKHKWRQPQSHWAMETSNFEHSCDGMMSLWYPYKSRDAWNLGDCLQEKQGIDGEAIFVRKETLLAEILKQKNGDTGIVKALDFIPEYSMFTKYNNADNVRLEVLK